MVLLAVLQGQRCDTGLKHLQHFVLLGCHGIRCGASQPGPKIYQSSCLTRGERAILPGSVSSGSASWKRTISSKNVSWKRFWA
eukprot:10518891-Lingulodinium_polyedra.AAC.1